MNVILPNIEAKADPHRSGGRYPKRRRRLSRERILRFRQSVMDGLTHQIRLALDNGYTRPRPRYIERGGHVAQETIQKQPAPWWFDEDGLFYIRLNFADRTIYTPNASPLIRIGTRQNLLPALKQLRTMVGEGKLDDVIDRMVMVSA